MVIVRNEEYKIVSEGKMALVDPSRNPMQYYSYAEKAGGRQRFAEREIKQAGARKQRREVIFKVLFLKRSLKGSILGAESLI